MFIWIRIGCYYWLTVSLNVRGENTDEDELNLLLEMNGQEGDASLGFMRLAYCKTSRPNMSRFIYAV